MSAIEFTRLLQAAKQCHQPDRIQQHKEHKQCEGIEEEEEKEMMPKQHWLTNYTMMMTPSRICYDGAFLSKHEQTTLTTAILSMPSDSWATLTRRKLLNLGGVPHPNGLIVEPLPFWLQPLLSRLKDIELFTDGPPNQALVNLYSNGSGIGAHKDGPLYESYAVIISLLSPALLEFINDNDDVTTKDSSILLGVGSLLYFDGDAYNHAKHTIASRPIDIIPPNCINADVGTSVSRGDLRLSITLRRVKKISWAAGDASTGEQFAEIERRENWWRRAVSETV